MQPVPIYGIRACGHSSISAEVVASRNNRICLSSQRFLNSVKFRRTIFDVEGRPGILTLNTHSDSAWNAFPHTHSWHVFVSVLSRRAWELGDSCACSSFISQQDSKMERWQEAKIQMKTSITGLFHLVNDHDVMQQDKTTRMTDSCIKDSWFCAASAVSQCFLQPEQSGSWWDSHIYRQSWHFALHQGWIPKKYSKFTSALCSRI